MGSIYQVTGCVCQVRGSIFEVMGSVCEIIGDVCEMIESVREVKGAHRTRFRWHKQDDNEREKSRAFLECFFGRRFLALLRE